MEMTQEEFTDLMQEIWEAEVASETDDWVQYQYEKENSK